MPGTDASRFSLLKAKVNLNTETLCTERVHRDEPPEHNCNAVAGANHLVARKKIILAPLHIKLGVMKQFVKALDKNLPCFQYLCTKLSSLPHAKMREGIFYGPQIRKLMIDHNFTSTMNETEENVWNAFKEVVKKFLGNVKDPRYKEIVGNMMDKFKVLGYNMYPKLHFLMDHIDYFPENLGVLSEEQGERLHQNLKEVERRYQGRWDINMMADYCWSIARDDSSREYSRTSHTLRFHFSRGAKAAEEASNIYAVCEDNDLGESTARIWFSRFKKGRFDISDTPCSIGPSGFYEDRLNTLIHNDPRELANVMNCDHSTIVRHLLPPTETSSTRNPRKTTNKTAIRAKSLQYLRKIKKYREEGRSIFYMDDDDDDDDDGGGGEKGNSEALMNITDISA
ncbi:hypothetical protein ANN_03177 [Periplaneta americana]|uniref:Mos1 transposase HTH domain-containing protein n=1 Tax=Periplaneta americana TaxID=6978 RepID=A0ABQ8TYA6_PERAM|nr:hypothetical protein ANN_03177 [Periplaneta americana]